LRVAYRAERRSSPLRNFSVLSPPCRTFLDAARTSDDVPFDAHRALAADRPMTIIGPDFFHTGVSQAPQSELRKPHEARADPARRRPARHCRRLFPGSGGSAAGLLARA